jgi:hypothetical protein
MFQLGISDLSQLGELTFKLQDRASNPPTPKDYPSEQEFEENLAMVVVRKHSDNIPAVPAKPTASDVAKYGNYDWSKVDKRGAKTLEEYLYGLGKVLSDRFSYGQIFNRQQEGIIVVKSNYAIEEGRHRSLTLKTLGPNYVSRRGMDRWVEAERLK